MRWFISLFLLLAVALTWTGSIAAHGGGDLIARSVPVGPYFASVWVNPPDPRAQERIHFTIGLASPDDGSPVLDADIQVTMQEQSSGETVVRAPATTEQSVNKLFYETDIEVPAAGEYETEFHIRGTEGEGTVSLLMEVQAPTKVNWLMIGLAGLGLVVVIGWWRSRQAGLEATDA